MGRTPWSAADPLVGFAGDAKSLVLREKSGTGASRADQGSAPRIMPDTPPPEIYAALSNRGCAHRAPTPFSRRGRLESRPAGKIAQCRIVFPLSDICANSGADAHVRSRPPGRPLLAPKHPHPQKERDEGVPRRPGGLPHLISEGISPLGKLCGIGQDCLPHIKPAKRELRATPDKPRRRFPLWRRAAEVRRRRWWSAPVWRCRRTRRRPRSWRRNP